MHDETWPQFLLLCPLYQLRLGHWRNLSLGEWDRSFCELVHSFTKLLWTLWASDIHEMCLTLQAFFFLLAYIDTALTCIPWHMKSHVQSTLRNSFSRSCWTQRWTRIVSAPCGLWILHQVQPFWSTSPNWNIQMMLKRIISGNGNTLGLIRPLITCSLMKTARLSWRSVHQEPVVIMCFTFEDSTPPTHQSRVSLDPGFVSGL